MAAKKAAACNVNTPNAVRVTITANFDLDTSTTYNDVRSSIEDALEQLRAFGEAKACVVVDAFKEEID